MTTTFHEVNLERLVEDCGGNRPVCHLQNASAVRSILALDDRVTEILKLCDSDKQKCGYKNFDKEIGDPYATICVSTDMLRDNMLARTHVGSVTHASLELCKNSQATGNI